MSASRRARIDRLRRVAQKRVLAAEVEVSVARGLWEQARAAVERAEAEATAALSRWTDIVCADELAMADARRVTLRKTAERARLLMAERERERAAKEHALVAERQGEMRLEKVLERLATAEAAKAATRERRAGDEHASRLAQLGELAAQAERG